MSLPAVEQLLVWVELGQRQVERAVGGLSDDDLAAPSRLPGWSRGHVSTHLARNADALVNLLTWASTGTPSPMYPSTEHRNADIEAGAGRPAAEQRADLHAAGERFARAARLPETAWQALVSNAQGVQIPAAEVPWMRTRELWLHLVDLDAGATVDVIPPEVAATLVHDVAAALTPRVEAGVLLRPDGYAETRLGPADPPSATISGPASRIAGWLTGRAGLGGLHCDGEPPALPAWL